MASTTALPPESPPDSALSLTNLSFPSHPSAFFRVDLRDTAGDLPMRLWLEDKKTKAQWECVTSNIADHVPSGASYALPSDVVVTFLKRAMQGTTPETCHVALQDLENGYIQVVLIVAILGVLDEVFLFKMVPLAIDRIDVVEAKIRDLEESIANSSQGRNVSQEPEGEDAHDHVTEERGTVNRAYFSLKCTKATWKNELVVWTDDLYSDPEYFKWCDEDRAVITLVHPGGCIKSK
ncbi:hypothetical protein H257_12802 [Aphanomyces astaci]|uniref:Uncharacterized protein n=1 Tax=Aphanomyces astaci TaxID=112090 RepID=W4FYE5_APHAT|nr:hypothetical protein H257_12802 [Aphanomyces astaci]ETV71991.1 hypothetical protein H257_12802 [Aphanomyces astaci]|eukprot:XP_009838434.1 hypothetical protein H257_12802 [Aphanomyces astaci]